MKYIFSSFVALFILNSYCLCSSNRRQGSSALTCKPPNKGIKEPYFAQRKPTNFLSRKWKLDSMVSYTCPAGYKFPDGHHIKISTCSMNRFHSPQWQPNKFYDCLPYCPECLNGGRCVVRTDAEHNLSFQCKCSEELSFTGSICQYAKCTFPPIVSNSQMEVFPSKHEHVNDMFTEGTRIVYKCDNGYQLVGSKELQCTNKGSYLPIPPSCLKYGKITTCPNQFSQFIDDYTRKNLLGDKRVVPDYFPRRNSYQVDDSVNFRCPSGYRIEGQTGAVSLQSHCYDSGTWSLDWPICKAKICEEPLVTNAVLTSQNEKNKGVYYIGDTIKITCLEGYYIFESAVNEFKCMSFGYWNPKLPDCITRNVYKNKCLLNGRGTRYTKDGQPYCSNVSLLKKEQSQNELNAITIVTASAASIFGVLLLIVLVMALQRRRLLHRIRRQAEIDAQEMAEDRQMTPYEAMIHFILPSYDEAVRTKPTASPPSFEESLQDYCEPNDDDDVMGDETNNIYVPPTRLSRSNVPSTSSNVTIATLIDTDDTPPPYCDSTNENGATSSQSVNLE